MHNGIPRCALHGSRHKVHPKFCPPCQSKLTSSIAYARATCECTNGNMLASGPLLNVSHLLYNSFHKHSNMTSTTDRSKKELPPHHDPCGKGFVNPWPSFIRHGTLDLIKMLVEFDRKQSKVTEQTSVPKIVAVNKPLMKTLSHPRQSPDQGLRHDKVATTWLGQ